MTAATCEYPRYSTGPQAQHFRGITIDRLDQFEGGQWGAYNLTSALYEYVGDMGVSLDVWHAPGTSKPTFEEAQRHATYEPYRKGDRLGPSWTNHWVRATLQVPEQWRGKERVTFEFDPGCEGLIFDVEGLPLQGITGGYDINRRVDFILDDKAQTGTYTIYIEVACNEMFGNPGKGAADADRYFVLDRADIVVYRMEAWRLLWDFRVIKDLARTLPSDSHLCNKALGVANAMANIFKHDDFSSIARARKEAHKILGEAWEKQGAEIYKNDNAKDGPTADVWAISNCHIDTAWLWPFTCTQQKVARSWSSQVDLMNRYPEHRFACSQAQQFKWLEQLYPRLFDVVKDKIKEGAFQPIGGTWVEMDANMPSGEAICRQFVYGQRYFKSRFGKFCETFWLPDTFGYSSQLPQLCRLAGMRYFFTQKLSWSQFNTFPHSTFNWVGIDGSQILTHMTPVDTYTAQANVGDVNKAITNHKSLEQDGKALLAFGNGDGGGGSTAPMLESLRRIRAAANGHRDIAKVTMGKSVDDFFKAIERDSEHGQRLASWQGELYLELHRGTYTSHASMKRHNRKSETLLREIEYVATLASIHARSDNATGPSKAYRYPKDELDELWEDVLLCQFHDVLPGSAIGLVYEDAERIYANVAKKGRDLLEDAFLSLFPASHDVHLGENFSLDDSELFLVDTLDTRRNEVQSACLGTIEAKKLQKDSGQLFHAGFRIQPPVRIEDPVLLLHQPMGEEARVSNVNGQFVLSNSVLQATVSPSGRLVSLLDLRIDRELISSGRSAGFVIYQDRPHSWDAWDVDIYHLETPEDLEASSIDIWQVGPLRASLRIKTKVGDSTIETILSIDATAVSSTSTASTFLRYENKVDWRERHRFLKYEAPVTVRSDVATYETQFGTIGRPTHRNTTWDRAKFEVCGHKFADLSEYGYGVALLNDCKYGYAVEGQVMRLSLLRAATSPDEEQDQGQHIFNFALYPHANHFIHSDVPAVARAFNTPMHLRRRPKPERKDLTEAALFPQGPFKINGAPNVFIDTLKRSDDDEFSVSGHLQSPLTIILRLYEAFGGKTQVMLHSDLPIRSATLCDVLERDLHPLEVNKGGLRLDFEAFQVQSVKMVLRSHLDADEYEFVSVSSNDGSDNGIQSPQPSCTLEDFK